MLPGIGAGEYIVIAILALVVIGPKDLPMLMRKLGAFINRLRGMAAEFRASFDEMARQSELDELRKQVEELRTGQLIQPMSEEIAPAMTAIENDIRDGWTGAGVTAAAPMETTAPKKRKAASSAKPPKAAAKPAPAKPAKAPAAKVTPTRKPAPKPAKPAKPKAPTKGARS